MRGADISEANLSGVTMIGGILHSANLKNTNLIEAILSGTDLSEANLSGADLSGANLNGAILKNSLYDKHTRWPKGFDPIASGAILEP